MINSENLVKGQRLRILLDQVGDRLPKNIYSQINEDPYGVWNGGFKMVDGNSFGLVIELSGGNAIWFFECELSEL